MCAARFETQGARAPAPTLTTLVQYRPDKSRCPARCRAAVALMPSDRGESARSTRFALSLSGTEAAKRSCCPQMDCGVSRAPCTVVTLFIQLWGRGIGVFAENVVAADRKPMQNCPESDWQHTMANVDLVNLGSARCSTSSTESLPFLQCV